MPATLLAALAGTPATAVATEPLASSSAPSAHDFVPGEVIVRYRAGTDAAERADVRGDADADLERKLPAPASELLALDGGDSPRAAARELERRSEVLYAEPNYVRRIAAVPNDARFTSLWGLHNTGQSVAGFAGTPDADIDAPEAWDLTTGQPSTTVAVVDTGVAHDHPDLAPNLYLNPGETGAGREGNGIDDDGNGKVDDSRGWDWVGDDSDARDLNGHGTHVAGTLGARGGDGYGIAGVNWNARIMPLRVLDASGFGSTADVIAAYAYASRAGARVVNASLGGSGFSQAERDTIAAAPNTVFVVAAGNGGDDGVGDDNDVRPEYPCGYDLPNIICVAATDSNDALTGFSNFGARSVDLAAPGRATLSAQPARESAHSEDFEIAAVPARWTTGGRNNTWGVTQQAASGGRSSITDSPAGDYAGGTDSFAQTAVPISLAGRSGCTLEYGLRLAVQDGVDQLRAEASTDGATWTTLSATAESTGGRFQRLTDELSAFDGAAVLHLRFRLTTDAGVNADGAYVDDVRVRCLSPVYTGGEFAYYSGTSMATPHVAGAAALVLGRRPGASTSELRAAILDGVDARPALAGKTASGGRLNAFRAVAGEQAENPIAPAPAPSPEPAPDSTAPAPAPADQPSQPADRTAPAVSVSISRQRLRTVLRRGLSLSVRCSEDCRLRSELVLGRSAARRLRIAARGTTRVRVGYVSVRLSAATRRTVLARLSRRARRRLSRARRVELAVLVRATDAGGNSRVVERRVVLRR